MIALVIHVYILYHFSISRNQTSKIEGMMEQRGATGVESSRVFTRKNLKGSPSLVPSSPKNAPYKLTHAMFIYIKCLGGASSHQFGWWWLFEWPCWLVWCTHGQNKKYYHQPHLKDICVPFFTCTMSQPTTQTVQQIPSPWWGGGAARPFSFSGMIDLMNPH